MNELKEKAFYDFYDLMMTHYRISSKAIVLMFKLMEISHVTKSQNTFSISMLILAKATSMKPSTLYWARNILRSRRLISWEYKAGKGCSKYTLLPLNKKLKATKNALWPLNISDFTKHS